MPEISTFTLLAITVPAAVIFLARQYQWRRKLQGCKLPPGPKGWPIIGNLLDLPSEQAWVKFRDWSRTYGTAHSQFNTSIILTSLR